MDDSLPLLLLTGKRVRIGNQPSQPIRAARCIDLRRRDISMPKHGLQAAQISPTVQHMRGKRMPDFMRSNPTGVNLRGHSDSFEKSGKLLPRHRTAIRGA